MIGGKIISGAGILWRQDHGALVPQSPPHVLGGIDPTKARKLREAHSGYLIRWEPEFDVQAPTEWWHVIKDKPQDISELKPKVRYAVRQGHAAFFIKRCERERICEDGYPVYSAAFDRYETFEMKFDRDHFVAAVSSMPEGTEFWVLEEKETGTLCAFAENIVLDNACFYSSMWFTAAALKGGGSYALIHEMNEHYLRARDLLYVSDGARNINHLTNIHEFLQSKFGFRKAYCILRIEYAPLVAILVECLYPMRRILRRWPISRRLNVLLDQERIHRSCRVS